MRQLLAEAIGFALIAAGMLMVAERRLRRRLRRYVAPLTAGASGAFGGWLLRGRLRA